MRERESEREAWSNAAHPLPLLPPPLCALPKSLRSHVFFFVEVTIITLPHKDTFFSLRVKWVWHWGEVKSPASRFSKECFHFFFFFFFFCMFCRVVLLFFFSRCRCVQWRCFAPLLGWRQGGSELGSHEKSRKITNNHFSSL